MALAHLHATVIGAGSCPIASAAYRHRTEMTNTFGEVVSYAHLSDLAHEEIALPANAPAWLTDLVADKSVAAASEALALAVVAHERRVDAQFYGDKEIALPVELDHEQRLALVREFIADQFTARGLIVDWVMHVPTEKADNPHIHLMHTIRELTPNGFGRKCIPVLDEAGQIQRIGGKIVYQRFLEKPAELKALRAAWGDVVNKHLALAGFDVRIDMRSYAEQGIAIAPTTHVGPRPNAMAQRFGDIASQHDHALSRARAVADVVADPGQLLVKISRERSTFSGHDIARALSAIVDEKSTYHEVLARVMAHPDLVIWAAEIRHPETNRVMQPARYATREIVEAEAGLARAADRMAAGSGFGACPDTVNRAIIATQTANAGPAFTFAPEQITAVRHVTGDHGIAAVVGIAGAGKSTMLAAANRVWVADHRRVFGAALAGKAAAGLQSSSGIASRTLHAWEFAWSQGRDQLQAGDVFVIDEAGMVGSLQLSRIVAVVEGAGAKLVLVGDDKQLQPIEAGAAFRAITDRIDSVALVDVRRQRQAWAKTATTAFGRGDAASALDAYRDRGHIVKPTDRAAARTAIVADYMAARNDLTTNGQPLRGDALLVLAHTNADVFALNTGIREALALQPGALREPIAVETARGPRDFAVGDRVIFLKNERFTEAAAPELGRQRVTNGMVGTVTSTTDGVLRVAIDDGAPVAFRASTYHNVDWGYAATVHKNQGTTVDRTFVLATPSMDHSLSYVAMSRYRDQATLYAAKEDFVNHAQLVATLGRVREKTTTLDPKTPEGARAAVAAFAASRAADTAADVAPAFAAKVALVKAWVAESSRQLGEVWGKVERAIGAARERVSPTQGDVPKTQTTAMVAATAAPVANILDDSALVTAPQRGLEPKPAPKPKSKSIFDGFRPAARPTLALSTPPEDTRLADALGTYLELRATHEALRITNTKPAVFEVTAFKKAAKVLDEALPHTVALFQSALRHDPKLEASLADLSGPPLVRAVVDGLRREHRALRDPDVRAARFVDRWNKDARGFNFNSQARSQAPPEVVQTVRNLVAALAKDPAAQAALHAHPDRFKLIENGALARATTQPNVAQALTERIERALTPPAPDRSLGFSR